MIFLIIFYFENKNINYSNYNGWFRFSKLINIIKSFYLFNLEPKNRRVNSISIRFRFESNRSRLSSRSNNEGTRHHSPTIWNERRRWLLILLHVSRPLRSKHTASLFVTAPPWLGRGRTRLVSHPLGRLLNCPSPRSVRLARPFWSNLKSKASSDPLSFPFTPLLAGSSIDAMVVCKCRKVPGFDFVYFLVALAERHDIVLCVSYRHFSVPRFVSSRILELGSQLLWEFN